MIPSHGRVYSLGLLASVASLGNRPTLEAWVQAAREHGSYLAAANDLAARAEEMLVSGLARRAETGIYASPQLGAILDLGNGDANLEVARLLLTLDPPPWLTVAVSGESVQREYIPDLDLLAMMWLEPNLDRLLCEVRDEVDSAERDAFKSKFGLAAENLVMAALRRAGRFPIHVAMISSAFGYDVEVRGDVVDRIEVKAAGPKTKGRFHLTRNEFDKSVEYGDEWRLLQVVFTDAAFAATHLGPRHIVEICELGSQALRELVPPDTDEFRWDESGVVAPPAQHWRRWHHRPDAGITVPGFI